MKRLIAILALALAAAGGVAAAPANHGPLSVASAKSCSGSYTHAVIGGAEKCLRRGQYCARGSDSQYRRYGFRCQKRDGNGSYHLT